MTNQSWKHEDLGGPFGTIETRVVAPVGRRTPTDPPPTTDLVRLTDPHGDILYCHPDDVASIQESPLTARRGVDLTSFLTEEVKLPALEGLAAQGVEAVVRRLEAMLEPYLGLQRISASVDALETPDRWTREAPDTRRSLVLVHGAFSLPHHSFAGLSRTPAWASLRAEYGDRIFAFGSPTVTESPIVSARNLLESLPNGAQIDLLTYSRGGLVGELVAGGVEHPVAVNRAAQSLVSRAQTDLPDRRRGAGGWVTFAEREAIELVLLEAVLERKQVTVHRHTRVASPVGGTPLAGKRLDRWLSFLIRAAGLLAGSSFVLGFLKRTALEIIRAKADASLFAGIGAMDPDGPLVRAIAERGPSRAVTTAVTGDLEPEGVLARVGMLAVDYFFGEPNDLVVPTRAMWLDPIDDGAPGSLDRKQENVVALGDPTAHHFGYFAHPVVRDHLRGISEQRRGAGVRLIVNSFGLFDRELETKGDRSAPHVLLLPGIMGTALGRAKEVPIWLRAGKVRREFASLKLPDDGTIEPRYLFAAYYGSLLDGLAKYFRVEPWKFDWRQSMLDTAEKLRAHVVELLHDSRRAVHFVAHSMGGVVTMAMLNRLGKAHLDELVARKSTFVMMATPIRGAYKPIGAFTGTDPLMRALDLVDGGLNPLPTARTFAGALELLSDEVTNDPEKLRQVLDLCKPSEEAKKAAIAFWAERKTWFDKEDPFCGLSTHYVFGRDTSTTNGVTVRDETAVYTETDEGDGTVPWDAAFAWNNGEPHPFPTVRYWSTEAAHGDVADRILPEAVRDLIVRGEPEYMRGLGRGRPSRRGMRGPGEAKLAPRAERVPLSADERLALAAFGALPQPERRAEPLGHATPIEVKIVHGSLHTSPASATTVLGVFEGEPPQAEAMLLDRKFGPRLAALWAAGGWPLQAGAHAYVPEDAATRAPAVLVVNLGRAARLSRRGLRDTLTRVLRAHVLGSRSTGVAAPSNPKTKPARNLALGTFGTDGPNPLGPEEALGAIVEAVVLANRSLSRPGVAATENVPFGVVRIYEPYRDIAIRLLGALAKIERWTTLSLAGGEVVPQQKITKSDGYLGAMPVSDGANETWNRITVYGRRAKEHTSLEIITGHGNAARRRSTIKLPPSFVEDSQKLADDRDTALDPIGRFSAASNRFLREAVLEGQGLVFDVNAASAPIPWELLLPDASEESPSPRDAVVRVFLDTESSSDMVPASARTALVIGNPTPKGTTPLPGAEDEADDIRDQLGAAPGGRWSVTRAGKGGSLDVLGALGNGRYRILHMATHGRVTPKGRGEIYLGDGMWDGAELIDRMAEIPQLVFLNACYAGAALDATSAGSASLAQAFFRKGVRAMVITGWAVGDAAARTFATTFFEEVLDGSTFGRAVRRARFETRRQHPHDNTWAAFQCYGEPSTVIVPEARLDRRLRRLPATATSGAIVDFLVSLHGDAKLLTSAERSRVTDAIEALEKSMATSFDGEVWRKVGILWLEIGHLERATKAFDHALGWSSAELDVLGYAARAHLERATTDSAQATWITKLEAASIVFPDLAGDHHRVIAHARLRLGDVVGAGAAFRKAQAHRHSSAGESKNTAPKLTRDTVDIALFEWATDGRPLPAPPPSDTEVGATTFHERLAADRDLFAAVASDAEPDDSKVAALVEGYARLGGRVANLWAREVHAHFAALVRTRGTRPVDATARVLLAVVERLAREVAEPLPRVDIGPAVEGLSDEALGAALAGLGLAGLTEGNRFVWEWRNTPLSDQDLAAGREAWLTGYDDKVLALYARGMTGPANRGLQIHIAPHSASTWPTSPTDVPSSRRLVELLLAAPGVSAVSFESDSAPRLWDWPLDVGVFGGDYAPMKNAMHGVYEGKFVVVHDGRAASAKLELVLFPGTPEELLAELRDGLALPEVHTVLALGGPGDGAHPVHVLHSLRAATEAAVAGALDLRGVDIANWLVRLVRELSHDVPLDSALFALPGGTVPLLVGSRGSFAGARGSHVARAVGTELVRSGGGIKSRGPTPTAESILGPQGGDLSYLGSLLLERARGGGLPWDHEHQTASALLELRNASRELRARTDARVVHGRLRLAGSAVALEPAPLARETAYELDVTIAVPKEGWLAAPSGFPEELLPEAADGHSLTIVFAAPEVTPEPLVGTLWLPRVGEAQMVSFPFELPRASTALDGRVTVLYRGRILQTLKVRAGVAGTVDATPLSIALEAVISAGFGGLDGRPPFHNALVFNDSLGASGLTVCGADDAGYFRLGQVDEYIDLLRDELEKITQTPADFAKSDSESTRNLIVTLARAGARFAEGLRAMRKLRAILPVPFAKARRIQVLSVHPEKLIPVEYLYDGPLAKENATLCEGWRKALLAGLDAEHHCSPSESRVCPLAFWGLRHTIERPVYDEDDAERLVGKGANFQFRNEAVGGRAPLSVSRVLVGWADRARNFDEAAFDASLGRIDVCLEAKAMYLSRAPTWNAWVAEVGNAPDVLVMLAHTEVAMGAATLELGTERLDPPKMLGKHVRTAAPEPQKPGPIVFLLGCRTVEEQAPFSSFITDLRNAQASVVIATMSTVRGRHMIEVAEKLVASLVTHAQGGPMRVGDFVTRLRRTLLAEDLPVGLALVSYGDIDWQLGGTT